MGYATTKTCRKCGETKPEDEFYSQGNGKRRSRCKDCIRNGPTPWTSARVQKRHRVKKDFGLTLEEYEAILAEAIDKPCPICGVTLHDNPGDGAGLVALDHCHRTGKVRGVICSRCNVAIGLLADDAERAAQAAKWLATASLTHSQ